MTQDTGLLNVYTIVIFDNIYQFYEHKTVLFRIYEQKKYYLLLDIVRLIDTDTNDTKTIKDNSDCSTII